MINATDWGSTVKSVICSLLLCTAMHAVVCSAASMDEAPPVSVAPPSGDPGPKPTRVVQEKDFATYLFTYFKDDDHSLHFALSRDGYTFTDVNRGHAIMNGADLGDQKGIRDPHIMRGPDGGFYLSMTDLHLFAQKLGLRKTEWERPANQYGWGNNHSLVFMKSYDLIHWTHTIYHIGDEFPSMKDIGCAWAPQTIYDAEKKKLMVSFTTRFGNGRNKIYYAYADDAFTKFETEPKELFKYPRDVNIIDSDITKVDDKYHLFYVAHEKDGGIKQAISDRVDGGYVFDPAECDTEKTGCEAPNVWKRTGTNTYVLMIDVFGLKPHNFGFYETTDFSHFKSLGHFNDGVMKMTNVISPKHGAIIPITLWEADALAKQWNYKF